MCKCLEYGDSYLDNCCMGMGNVILIQEGKRIRECTYTLEKKCFCAVCTNCPEHNIRSN